MSTQIIKSSIEFIRELYQSNEFIPLHAPVFNGNERKYLMETIDSTFVSSVGAFVDQFEREMQLLTKTDKAVATMNGTAALHISLVLAGVANNDEVLSQSLTFVATCNAISYCNAHPVFIDVDIDTMGMSPIALKAFLTEHAELREDGCYNKSTQRRIKGCVPMHTFGFPCRIDEIKVICDEYQITLIEDAAESIGSYYQNKHTGSFGQIGTFSFNGNKTLTSGGGGCVVTDLETGNRAKYITTTAKVPHAWEFQHSEIGYNYRMPNLNAALACAQLEQLDDFISNKRLTASKYSEFFKSIGVHFVEEIEGAEANYWLMTLQLKDREERDLYLTELNNAKVMCRPVWNLMHTLPMFANAQTDDLKNSKFLADRLVNIPSSVIT